MTAIRIIGKKGSKSRLAITRATGIPRYGKNNKGVCAIINYGLAGNKLDLFLRNNPSAVKLPMLNKHIGRSKYHVVKDAEEQKILVPETKIRLTKKDKVSDWIEKKYHSVGGAGICKATRLTCSESKYFQKFIKNRKYELRVHAFEWTKNWHIQKRIGDPDEIAWNYKNGGKFINVRNTEYSVFQEAIEISKKILEMRRMSFGAIDFIVDMDNSVFFIEINSAPGFTEFSEHIYVNAFNKLKELSNKKIVSFSSL